VAIRRRNTRLWHAVTGTARLMWRTDSHSWTLVLLARAFSSVVLAAKAVVLTSYRWVAAHTAFMVLFWQQGSRFQPHYGVPATGAIRDFIPISSSPSCSGCRWPRGSCYRGCARNTKTETPRREGVVR